MESGAEDPQVDAVLDTSICADPAVEFVVAFGSRPGGEATPASDLDVAVKFADDLSAGERFDKRCFLSGDLQQDDAPFIDLSDIETLPLDVAHDAVNGTFVCGNEHGFKQFKTTIEAAFDDQRGTLRRRQRDVIDRIAAEGFAWLTSRSSLTTATNQRLLGSHHQRIANESRRVSDRRSRGGDLWTALCQR